ncbi:MAG: EamA/RhaT family transporter, partial [Cognatishimia sp.]
GQVVLLILGSALGSAAGNYLLVLANRRAEASLIAPLVYSQLITATLASVVIFGDLPNGLALIGLGLILISGGASLWLRLRDDAKPA